MSGIEPIDLWNISMSNTNRQTVTDGLHRVLIRIKAKVKVL